MRTLIGLLISILVIAVGCAEPDASSPPGDPTAASGSTVSQNRAPEAVELDFTIIDSDVRPGVKRGLTVRLSEKVTEEELRGIALRLKAQDSRHYERTFITYYLPGMTVGAGAWATTHFDPELEVQILGLTTEEEEAFVSETAAAGREIVGRWVVDGAVGSTITIYREGGDLYLEQVYGEFGSRNEKMIEGKSPRGRRFESAEGSDAGDHYVITSGGALELRDNEGLISNARKVD